MVSRTVAVSLLYASVGVVLVPIVPFFLIFLSQPRSSLVSSATEEHVPLSDPLVLLVSSLMLTGLFLLVLWFVAQHSTL